MVRAVIDTWIKIVVQFHNVLHWFCARIGARTAIIELILAQELASVDHDPLLLLFLDLSKAYVNLYQGRLIQTIEGCGEGSKIWVLLAEYWSVQEVVTQHNSFCGPQFRETRGMTKGGLALTTLFNVAVDSVICHWLSLTVEENSATHDGIGMVVGRCIGMFYADDSMIRSRDPEWLQGSINFLVLLLRRVDPMANVAKFNTMNC